MEMAPQLEHPEGQGTADILRLSQDWSMWITSLRLWSFGEQLYTMKLAQHRFPGPTLKVWILQAAHWNWECCWPGDPAVI
jgi:hypothetical protein